MASLSKEKLREIIQNAPPGTDPAEIINELRARGHELEGYGEPQEEEKGYISRVAERAGETIERRSERLGEISDLTIRDQSLAESAFQTAGTAIGGFGEIAFGAIAEATPEAVKEKLIDVLGLAAPVIEPVMERMDQLKEENPRLYRNLAAALEVGELIPAGKSVSMAQKGVGQAGRAVGQAGRAIGRTAAGAKDGILGRFASVYGTTAETAKPLTSVLRRKGEQAVEFAKQAPERIRVAGEAAERVSRELGESAPLVARATSAGFSTRDAKRVLQAPTEQKSVFRDMKRQADLMSDGKPTKPPEDVAGSYLTNIIQKADDHRKEVGKRLGETVKDFKGEVVAAKHSALARLRKVPGLEDIKINNKGNLDFSGTTLSSSLTKADRRKINEAFRSIGGRDAYGLHQYRQELFEVLGGRKKAKVELTATQENAYEAIRKGLADSLEELSDDYKLINQEYAQVTQPLKNLRKFYRGLEDAGEDILDERSAILMRRLTGRAPSGQNIKLLTQELNEILAQNGIMERIDLQSLQDFQNMLDELYPENIAKTGFAGQTSLGITTSKRGIIEGAIGAVTEPLQSTPEFRRQILDELLEEMAQ